MPDRPRRRRDIDARGAAPSRCQPRRAASPFPDRETLLAASVSALVERNEQAVKSFRDALSNTDDRLTSAVAALAYAARQPAYLAELELWAVARTDRKLRATLVSAERAARREIERVHMQLFGDLAASEEYAEVVALTQNFIRGLAVSENVQISPRRRDQLIALWTEAIRPMLERGMKKKNVKKA